MTCSKISKAKIYPENTKNQKKLIKKSCKVASNEKIRKHTIVRIQNIKNDILKNVKNTNMTPNTPKN